MFSSVSTVGCNQTDVAVIRLIRVSNKPMPDTSGEYVERDGPRMCECVVYVSNRPIPINLSAHMHTHTDTRPNQSAPTAWCR